MYSLLPDVRESRCPCVYMCVSVRRHKKLVIAFTSGVERRLNSADCSCMAYLFSSTCTHYFRLEKPTDVKQTETSTKSLFALSCTHHSFLSLKKKQFSATSSVKEAMNDVVWVFPIPFKRNLVWTQKVLNALWRDDLFGVPAFRLWAPHPRKLWLCKTISWGDDTLGSMILALPEGGSHSLVLCQQREGGWPSRDTEGTQQPRAWNNGWGWGLPQAPVVLHLRAGSARWLRKRWGTRKSVTVHPAQRARSLHSCRQGWVTVSSALQKELLEAAACRRQCRGPNLCKTAVNTQRGCPENSMRTRASNIGALSVVSFDGFPLFLISHARVGSPPPSPPSNGFRHPPIFSQSFPSHKVFHLRQVMGCGVRRHQRSVAAAFMCVMEA